MKPLTKRQIRIVALYLGLGVAMASVAFAIGALPADWALWFVFAGGFLALELRSVEVNDRMWQSSSVMVSLTAGTFFALQGNSAAVAMVLMALVGPFTTEDFTRRRWFQPLANLGQIVVAAAGAGFVLDAFLGSVTHVDRGVLILVAVGGILASVAYTVANLLMVRYAVKTVYGVRNLLPWSGLHVLFTSQVVMGLIGGLLGAALVIVDRPAVVVLVLAVYVIANLSLSSYSQLREAHQSALRGFVKVLEARDLYTRGHTERVAYFSQLIGEELRYTGTQLERLRWASLIHDLGKLAIPGELLQKKGALRPDEVTEMREAAHKVEEILGEVDFLRPMVSISGVHYIDLEAFDSDTWSLDASIVATADAFEAMTSTRSYRMALSQTEAFAELRIDRSGRFFPDVIDALESGLVRTGEVYGGSTVPVVPELAGDHRG
ncbi:hypothetical protein BH23ACT5_BH23ACT5_02840 [soil metagenome]